MKMLKIKRPVAATLLSVIALIAVILISFQGMACQGQQVPLSSPVDVTVLHINDTHAHLEDIARMATLVKNTRGEVGADKVFMLDSGDVFMGTPYFNLMRGRADLEFMNMLGYDAMTLGNHEFDNYNKTPEDLNYFISHAQFPIVCTNIDVSQAPELKGRIVPYLIVERGGQKFGIIGLLTEDTVEIASPGK